MIIPRPIPSFSILHASIEEQEVCDIDSEKLILGPGPSLPMLDTSTYMYIDSESWK